ncbi:alpha/beta fold hydrolase [Streptomyces halstedii]|uniref:alpha/beta fold hydrolase n=1 Tax=Streptomyces halstedii TaxID=1944 RepID=UPI003460CC18
MGERQLGVVLIHGFKSAPSMWDPLRNLLTDDIDMGFVETLPFGYDTGLVRLDPREAIPSFDTVADSLKEFLDTEAAGYTRLMLVSHSQGGLITQRYLTRMLTEGRGADLARIRRVVLLACPNNGSQIGLQLRRSLLRRNPQEQQLRPLNEQINDTQRTVLRDIINAAGVTSRTCPIAFSVFAGESDKIVPRASAQSVFPDAAALPGNHSTIARPDSCTHRTYTSLRRLILASADSDPPGNRLKVYLEVAAKAACELPYPELSGKRPPLADIYLPQQARLHAPAKTESGHPRSAIAETLSANEILAQGETCVILGDPGGGKSSLLRTHLTASAERWRAGQEITAIPFLMPATALVGLPPSEEALAQAMKAMLLKAGMQEELTVQFFDSPPEPEVPWMVMVDGLDELINTGTRQDVLKTLAALSEQCSPYRFVVATRPLPSEELGVLGQRVPRYQLEPFSPDDLHEAIRRWFHALKFSDPDREADRLSAAIDDAELTEVARTPLMTAMLCQLFANDSTGLPRSRGEIYDRFVGLLHERQHTAGISGIESQIRAALKRWGTDAVDRAEHALNSLPKLIGYLAAEHYDGNTQSALDILTVHPDARPPARLSDYNTEVWRDFLGEALRRSGLLTLRGTEFVFLHQTFLEYFAARYAIREEALAHTISTRLRLEVMKWPLERGPDIGDAPSGGRMAWVPPPFQSSYLGFIIDLAYEKPGMNRLLMRWAADTLDGCEFIARQVHLGTRLPVCVTDTVASTLNSLSRNTDFEYHNRIRAVDALVELGSQRAQDFLHDLGLGTTFDGHVRLYRIAGGLAKIQSPCAIDLLNALERDTTLDDEHRQFAYVRLCWLTKRVPEQFTGET